MGFGKDVCFVDIVCGVNEAEGVWFLLLKCAEGGPENPFASSAGIAVAFGLVLRMEHKPCRVQPVGMKESGYAPLLHINACIL